MEDTAGFVSFVIVLVVFGVALFFTVFKFTLVREGTAKMVLLFGGFNGALLAKRNRTFDAEWNLRQGVHFGLPGGLRFVGIRGIHSIYAYDFKWIKAGSDGKLEDMQKKVDFILVGMDYVYGLRVKDAEDKQFIPLTVELTITASIVNPYLALFAVKNWFDAVVSRISPYVRDYLTHWTYEELIYRKDVQLDKDVFAQLNQPPKNSDGSEMKDTDGNPLPSIIKELRDRYGVEIHALETVNIDPPKEVRELTERKWKAAREAETRVGTTMDALMGMIASQTGLKLEEIKNEFKADPDAAITKYWPSIELSREILFRQMGLDAGAVRQIYSSGSGAGGSGGSDSIEQLLTRLLTVAGDAFRGAPISASRPAPAPPAPPAPVAGP